MTINAASTLTKSSSTSYQISGDKKVPVVSTFDPFVSKKEIKAQIKTLRAEVRKIQAEIDVANAQQIDLPFEYEDVENLNVIQGD